MTTVLPSGMRASIYGDPSGISGANSLLLKSAKTVKMVRPPHNSGWNLTSGFNFPLDCGMAAIFGCASTAEIRLPDNCRVKTFRA